MSFPKLRNTPKTKIELELDEWEIQYLSTTCLARVLNSAKHALPDNYDYLDDIEDSMIYENLRMRICNAVFIKREKEAKGD